MEELTDEQLVRVRDSFMAWIKEINDPSDSKLIPIIGSVAWRWITTHLREGNAKDQEHGA